MVAVAVLIVTCPCALSLATPGGDVDGSRHAGAAGACWCATCKGWRPWPQIDTVVFRQDGHADPRWACGCMRSCGAGAGLDEEAALALASALAAITAPASRALAAAAAAAAPVGLDGPCGASAGSGLVACIVPRTHRNGSAIGLCGHARRGHGMRCEDETARTMDAQAQVESLGRVSDTFAFEVAASTGVGCSPGAGVGAPELLSGDRARARAQAGAPASASARRSGRLTPQEQARASQRYRREVHACGDGGRRASTRPRAGRARCRRLRWAAPRWWPLAVRSW